VHDRALGLLRANDAIGLDEALRAERTAFERAVNTVTDDYINVHLDEATVRDAGERLTVAAERRLASLIPLALYRPGAVQRELRAHGGWMSRTQLRGGGMTWQQAWRFPWWVVGMALGSLLCRLERYPPIAELVASTWLNHHNERESFIGHPGEVGDAIATVFGPAPPGGQRWTMPAWSWLNAELRSFSWLADRYAEWLAGEEEPGASLAEFAMIDGLAEGFRSGGQVVAFWALQPDAASAFARRLYGDAGIRAEVAQAAGVDLETFDARAPEILADAQGIGMFPRTQEIANILRTGNFR
jgi:hypothetical protein